MAGLIITGLLVLATSHMALSSQQEAETAVHPVKEAVAITRLERLLRSYHTNDASMLEPDQVTRVQKKTCARIQNEPFASMARAERLLEDWILFQCEAVMELEHQLHNKGSGEDGHDHAGKDGKGDQYTIHIHDDNKDQDNNNNNVDDPRDITKQRPTRAHQGSGTVEYVTPGGVDLTYTIHINTEDPKASAGQDQPGGDWIAVAVSSTTRGTSAKDLGDLSLFSLMLPSLARTVEPGFRYRVVVVHDKGDAFYEASGRYEKIETWFRKHISEPLEEDIEIQLLMVSFENKQKKPGPAFNVMLRAADDFGAEWFYRINDDSEFRAEFASAMTSELLSMGLPYGAVGPLCKQGNTNILTHDFVHRTHLEIFETYYPPGLVDWWMDDWISRVYGSLRTRKIMSAEIIHHTHNHGTRYKVDYSNQPKLTEGMEDGFDRIVAWMEKNNLPQETIDEFKLDNFDHTLLSPEVMAKKVDISERPSICKALQKKGGVVPNQTWGTLDGDDQNVWKVNACDNYI